MSSTSVTLVGATGLVGTFALTFFLGSTFPFAVATLTRRPIPDRAASSCSPRFTSQVFDDLADATRAQVSAPGGIYVSCLGTTRRAAGGSKQQQAIDLDLNRDLARKAKADGADTLILVSTAGASANSYFPYARMKGQLEEEVKRMGFERCVILRPGFLLGTRAGYRPETTYTGLFRGLASLGLPIHVFCVEATDVAAAIVQLAAYPPPKGVTTLYHREIISLAEPVREAGQQ